LAPMAAVAMRVAMASFIASSLGCWCRHGACAYVNAS
jgi:hypothetical protein